jgi:ATP-binding cassette subfamily B protein
VVVERTAFARARAYLDYSRRAKWLAIVSGVAAGIFYVLLVLLLALLVDLLVTRGRVPNFAQLGLSEQEQFLETWKNLPEDARAQAVRHVGFGEFDASAKGPVANSDESRVRYAAWASLTGTENLPPPPGRANAEDLQKWAQVRGVRDAYFAAMTEHELRWRAYVWHYLREHVGADAANSYQPLVEPGDPLPVPGLGEENRAPHGILSLVVRLRNAPAGRLVNWFASVTPWAYEGSSRKDPNRTYLTGLLLMAIVCALARASCLVLMNLQAADATVEAVTRLRRSVYHHTLRLGDVSYHGNGAGPPDLFTRHVEASHEALFLWLTTAFRYPAQVVLLLGLALLIQPWLALAVVIFALLVWLMGGQIVAAFRRQGRAATRQASSRLVLLLESIRLMRLVKSYLMELFNQSRVERQLAEYTRAHRTRYRGEAIAKPILVLLGTLAGITLLYLAARIVLSDGMSLAGLSILVVAVAGLYPPVKHLLDRKRYLRRGREAAAEVFAFLDRRGEQVQYPDAEFLQPLAQSLEFREVSLREPGAGRDLLHNLNLTISAGEKVAVIGPSDEEKRALLFLIPRFFDPTTGAVKIDGRDLRWVTYESLRAQIGIVIQSDLIFNDTVANNIGCGDPGVNLPQVIEAAKLAHAHQFIQKLPYGYETPIGEIGHALRPGEQFRIALARAILRDPTLYIIEEPAGNLDDDTKVLLDDTFARALPGKTVLFLPHRISTLKMCDRVVLLHEGTVEAAGNHRELVHTSSLYKHLYYLEFNAFADVA